MTRDELCDEWKCRRSPASIASPGICAASRQPNLLEKPEARRTRRGTGWRGRRSGAAGAGRRSGGPAAGAGGCRGPVSRDARDSQRREPYADRSAPNLCRCAAATLMSHPQRPDVLKLKGFGRRLSRESRPAIPSAGGTISPHRRASAVLQGRTARSWFSGSCAARTRRLYSRESRITDYSGIHLCWCRAGSSDNTGELRA